VDDAVLRFMAEHRGDTLTRLAARLMDLGTSAVVLGLGALAFAVFVALGRHWRLAVAVGAAFVTADLTSAVLKAVLDRPRPPAPFALVYRAGSAMPSTHATRTAAVAAAAIGTTTWLAPRTRRVLAALLVAGVVLVGAVMVYLGGHWTTDVLAGWALGGAIGAAAAAAVRRPARRHPPPSVASEP
jgi:undecaprenyl-diphosphatase